MYEAIFVAILSIIILLVPNLRNRYFPKEEKLEKSEKVQLKGRSIYFDALKGFAILAVILIHVNLYYSEMFTVGDDRILNSTSNLGRFAIPVFIIISGLLLDPKIKGGLIDFYRRKVSRIFIPYLVASAVLLFSASTPKEEWIGLIVSGRVSAPFYFIIVLIQLYIIYPWLVNIARKRWFLQFSLFFSVFSNFLVFFVPYPVTVLFCGRFLLFFVFGIYMREFFLRERRISFEEGLFWLSLALVYMGFIFANPEIVYNARFFYGLAIFNLLLASKSFIEGGFLEKILSQFGKKSLWIFLFHYPIGEFIFKKIASISGANYFILVPTFILTAVISFLTALLCELLYRKMSALCFSTFIFLRKQASKEN